MDARLMAVKVGFPIGHARSRILKWLTLLGTVLHYQVVLYKKKIEQRSCCSLSAILR
jgi:hypothetical protein